MALQQEVDALVLRLRAANTDLNDVEAKSASGGFPKSALETISALSNGSGGTLLLGVNEADGFSVSDVDAAQLAADLGAACAEQMEPPVRPEIDIVTVDGRPIVAAVIDEMPVNRKPCFVKSRGIEGGSYIRTHDGDRRLTTYEIHVLRSSRGQPVDDREVVEGASLIDLDEQLVQRLLDRLRSTRQSVFGPLTDAQILRLLGVTAEAEGNPGVTLAGLLALGRYPQQFFPQLDATFVAYPTVTGEPLADGTRFLDNQSIDGPIPLMVDEAIAALRRNMKRRSIVVGVGREDRWEYPEEAVREIVANALMHRDHHPMSRGTQVRIALYPDRLEVSSPGGLWGPVEKARLGTEPMSSSRNAQLAKLLEDVEIPGTGRSVCENRGSGLMATAAALRSAGMEPPAIIDDVREFSVVMKNSGLLDEDAISWLSTLDTAGLVDRQRLGLAFLRRNQKITNEQYRTLTGCNSLEATRELAALGTRNLVEKSNDRRWTVWHLSDALTSQPGAVQLELAPVEADAKPARYEQLRVLLSAGPKSTRELAAEVDLTPQAVMYWIHKMEDDGVVEPTASNRISPKNRWRLVNGRR